MIKKFKLLIIFILLIGSKTHALNLEYEKQLCLGCYGNSKTYIGANGAKIYYTCTVNKLSKKFYYEELDLVFKQKT